MSVKAAIQAAHHYRALRKCMKHALLTYRYGREALKLFPKSEQGLTALLPMIKGLKTFAANKQPSVVDPPEGK